jgi:sulfatase modifying factor 1
VNLARVRAVPWAVALLGCGTQTWGFDEPDATADASAASQPPDAPSAQGAADGSDALDASEDVTDAARVLEAASPNPCPTGGATAMVRVPTAQGGFCIDVTETTDAQYAQFLQSLDGGGGTLPAECARAPSHKPDGGVAVDTLPVANVNWCDAYAYCAWAGKRLCGEIGGTGNVGAWVSATDDEWFAACSHSGTLAYPYGSTFVSQDCNGHAHGVLQRVAVASMAKCIGGYAGLFDMSGNVWEWEASCTNSSDGLVDPCRARGGGWFSDQPNLTCAADSMSPQNFDGGLYRTATWPFLGIRCCAD